MCACGSAWRIRFTLSTPNSLVSEVPTSITSAYCSRRVASRTASSSGSRSSAICNCIARSSSPALFATKKQENLFYCSTSLIPGLRGSRLSLRQWRSNWLYDHAWHSHRNGEDYRDHQADRHKDEASSRATSGTIEIANDIDTDKRTECAHTVDQRHSFTCHITRQNLWRNGEEGTIGGVHTPSCDDQQEEREPEIGGPDQVREVEGDGPCKQEGP